MLWSRLEPGHRHASFHAESQPSDGMPNGDNERKTQNVKRLLELKYKLKVSITIYQYDIVEQTKEKLFQID